MRLFQRPPVEPAIDQIEAALTDTLESLRWCQKNLERRHTVVTLRLCEMNVALLSMALELQMQGETERARSVLAGLNYEAHLDDAALGSIWPGC